MKRRKCSPPQPPSPPLHRFSVTHVDGGNDLVILVRRSETMKNRHGANFAAPRRVYIVSQEIIQEGDFLRKRPIEYDDLNYIEEKYGEKLRLYKPESVVYTDLDVENLPLLDLNSKAIQIMNNDFDIELFFDFSVLSQIAYDIDPEKPVSETTISNMISDFNEQKDFQERMGILINNAYEIRLKIYPEHQHAFTFFHLISQSKSVQVLKLSFEFFKPSDPLTASTSCYYHIYTLGLPVNLRFLEISDYIGWKFSDFPIDPAPVVAPSSLEKLEEFRLFMGYGLSRHTTKLLYFFAPFVSMCKFIKFSEMSLTVDDFIECMMNVYENYGKLIWGEIIEIARKDGTKLDLKTFKKKYLEIYRKELVTTVQATGKFRFIKSEPIGNLIADFLGGEGEYYRL